MGLGFGFGFGTGDWVIKNKVRAPISMRVPKWSVAEEVVAEK